MICTIIILQNVFLHLSIAVSHHEPVKTAEFAHDNRQVIIAKFAAFQTNVCGKLLQNGVDTERVRLFVTNRFPPGDCIPPSPANLTEVFTAITHHGLWDYFHYSPLVQIARTFGAGDHDIKDWVENYKKDLKTHTLLMTVDDYMEADLDVADPPPVEIAKYDPRYCCEMEWKTEFIDHSLHYLMEVWELFSSHYLVPDSPPTALLSRISKGCFSVTWLVPSFLIPVLIKSVKTDTDFLQERCILKVTVADQCIYEQVIKETASVSSLSTNHINCTCHAYYCT